MSFIHEGHFFCIKRKRSIEHLQKMQHKKKDPRRDPFFKKSENINYSKIIFLVPIIAPLLSKTCIV